MKSKLFILLFITLSLSNCKKSDTTKTETVFESVDPKTFSEALKSTDGAQLIDVRTPDEYNSKHIDNAVNIDINNPNFDLELAKLDKTKPVFVYCLSGGRSQGAASQMVKMGYQNVYNLGGINGWRYETVSGSH